MSTSTPMSPAISKTQSESSAPTATPPRTPPTSSVFTGLKASLGSGTFFHAHLQEGQRFEDAPTRVRYELSAFPIGPDGIVSAGTRKSTKTKTNASASACEEPPRGSQRHGPAAEKCGVPSASLSSTPTSLHPQQSLSRSPAKKWTRSASTTAMVGDNNDFWAMVADAQAQAAANGPSTMTPAARRYHYLTRSQSADAGLVQQAPKMHKQNASYSPGFGTPAYQEAVENMSPVSNAPLTWCPSRGRYLSPIEEVQFFPEKQGESASLHSTTSAQSNLFIHRSVRRTPSTSTLNSVHSGVARTPDEPNPPHGTSPSRLYGHPRPSNTLPVIPASPRESQNVFDSDPAISLEEAAMAYPMPPGYTSQVEYPVYEQTEEQDLGDMDMETLPTPRFAVPHYRSEYGAEEQDLGDALPRKSMPHSRTPSLLSRSESVRTELTYLTAQDSAAASRRASAMPPDDLEAGTGTGGRLRSPLADGDTTLVNTPAKTASPAARFKASIDTLLNKSPISRKPSGFGFGRSTPEPEAISTRPTSSIHGKWISHLQSGLKKRAPWGEGAGKPAEVLFWTGFLAPWCWLIGGWMLAHSGETMAEGLPSGAKEGGLPLHNASSLHLQLRQQRSRELSGLALGMSAEKHDGDAASVWEGRKKSSELDRSLHGVPFPTEESRERPISVQLNGDVSVLERTRLDPWVVRCRMAAVVSGMFILALCIVALVVLVRAL